MKYLVFLFFVCIFVSCSHEVWSVGETRVYWKGDTCFTEIKMPNVQYAQVFMESLKSKGFKCNKGCSECIGNEVVVKRLITAKGIFILIYVDNKRD